MTVSPEGFPQRSNQHDVQIERIDGSWVVQVVEAGNVTQHLFETLEFAESYAAGQRIRLNVG